MADLCTFHGVTLAATTGTWDTSLEIISMSGLDFSTVVLRKDSFSSAAGASQKCFAPIKDHTPLRMRAYFDDVIFKDLHTQVTATATDSFTLTFSGADGGSTNIVFSGKVTRMAMDEETFEDRPTMTIEVQHDGVSWT